MKALVIGSGGREHAILWALKRTAGKSLALYCAPGNGGISDVAQCLPIQPDDFRSLIDFANSNGIDLTIVGPEGPLAKGIVDEFERSGLKIVGPSKAGSRLESSKGFAKNFMRRHGIPTADYHIAASQTEALQILRSQRFGNRDAPIVVKTDGLAAGKGVIVASSRLEGETAVNELFDGLSAEATQQLLIEETLEGPEVSVLVFADGTDYVLMPPARDHKRVGDGDTGPNTGGMGAVTDNSVIDEDTLEVIRNEIIAPTLRGADLEGFPFKGILFVGLMLTKDGPKVLEYNVRFGDPETQAILVRVKTDLIEVFQSISEGSLAKLSVQWSDESSACVVIASEGYPGTYKTGVAINGLDAVAEMGEVEVFHAGTTKSSGGVFKTSGGRVLGITSAGSNLTSALHNCYAAVDRIKWQGMQYRRDIGRFRP